MLTRSRFFISATLVAVLFAALFVLSPVQIRACPAPPPDTLLSLFQKSDLIVVAEISGAKNGETLEENEYYTSSEIYRSLKVASTFKGKAPANFVFTQLDYQYKNRSESGEEPESEMQEEADLYSPYGYRGYSELKVGERYLFFFKWDDELSRYDLTDTVSGARKLNDYDLDVHKKRLRELQAITKMKNDQSEAIAAWMIRLVEEPSTRWDGVLDLRNGFDALEYSNSEEAEAEQPEETRLDEDFDSSVVAKKITDAQKEHLSSIAFSELQQNPALIEDFDYYGLISLVSRWDKTRLAMYAFNALQAADRTNFEKIKARMSFIGQITGDQNLFDIAEQFPISDAVPETEKATPEQQTEEKSEGTTDPTKPALEVKYEQPATAETENNPATDDQLVEKPVESSEVQPAPESKNEPEAKKLTPAETREKLFTDFVNRYQFLLANNFEAPEESVETTETEDTEK